MSGALVWFAGDPHPAKLSGSPEDVQASISNALLGIDNVLSGSPEAYGGAGLIAFTAREGQTVWINPRVVSCVTGPEG